MHQLVQCLYINELQYLNRSESMILVQLLKTIDAHLA